MSNFVYRPGTSVFPTEGKVSAKLTVLVALLVAVLCLAMPSLSAAEQVITTVTVGSNPRAIAVNPVTNNFYVANDSGESVSVIEGATNTVTATIGVGLNPVALAVNPETNTIYVVNQGASTVSVIDAASNTVIKTIPVGATPYAIEVNPVTNYIYVANGGTNTVTVINGTNYITSTVTVGTSPRLLAVNPATNTIYVANYTSANVSVINGANNSVVATVPMVATGGGGPQGNTPVPYEMAVNPVTNEVYVTNYIGASVTVINGGTGYTATSVATGTNPYGVAVNPVTNTIYVTNYNDAGATGLTVINGATNTPTNISTGGTATTLYYPWSVVVNPVTNRVYVAESLTGDISVIDGATQTATLLSSSLLPPDPWAMCINPVTNKIYAASYKSNLVSVIDGAVDATANLTVGTSPEFAAVNPVTNTIYVTNNGSGSLSVINGASGTVTATVTTGTNPLSAAVNPVTNMIYVPNSGSNSVTVVDATNSNATTTVPVGTGPGWAAVNPVTNQIYAANAGSANVTVIDATNSNATTTVPAGNTPWAIAVNPVTNKSYVTNYGDGTVTVIYGGTNTTATVPVGTNPTGVAVNPLTNTIYVSNNTDGTVSVIDGTTDTVTDTITAGNNPNLLGLNPITNTIYVPNTGDGTVTVINGTATTTLTVGSSPEQVAIDQVLNRIYVSNNGSNSLSVIDGVSNTVLPTVITTGADPYGVAVNPATGLAYIANNGSGNVTVVTPNTAQNIPLTIALQGVTDSETITSNQIFSTTNASPSFTATVTSSYSPDTPPPTALYYQVDTAQGPFALATQTSVAGVNPATYSFSLSGLSIGVHTVYTFAGYGDEATVVNSSREQSPQISNINAFYLLGATVSTTTSVMADVNPQVLGSPVNFTAYVAATAGTGIPGGSVSFYDGSTLLGTVPLDGTGHATYQTSSLASGTHNITAAYAGSGGYLASTSSVLQEVIGVMPTISWATPAAINYLTGVSSTQLDAVAYAPGTTTPLSGTYSYSAPAGFVFAAGSHTLYVYFAPTDTTDYLPVWGSTTLVVNPITPTFQWTPPAAIAYGTKLGVTQLDATASYNGSTLYWGWFTYSVNVNGVTTPASGLLLPAGSYTLTFAPTAATAANFTAGAGASVPLTVNPVTPKITWAGPAAITYGTALSATQLDATTTVPGTFAYSATINGVATPVTATSGTVLSAGAQTLSVTFTPTDSNDYTTATASTTITVNKAAPTITWPTPAPINYLTSISSTQLNATVSLPGTTTAPSGNLTYSVAAGFVFNAGSHQLEAVFTPTDTSDYATVKAVVTLVVSPITPTFQWNPPAAIAYGTKLNATQLDATATYNGTTVPASSFTYTVNVNGVTTPASGLVLAAGSYTLMVSPTTAAAGNFTPGTSASVPLTVNQVTPKITWTKPAAITYGTALSATQLDATASVSGAFAYSATISGVVTPVTATSGTVLLAGMQTLSVTFTPTDNIDYTTATASTTITVK